MDGETRALIELSTRRGLSDEEIAGFVGLPPNEVFRRREFALAKLGAECGVSKEGQVELERSLAHLDAEPRQARDPAPPGAWRPEGSRRSRVLVAGLLLLALALAGVLVGLSLDGDAPKRATSEKRAKVAPPPATRNEPPQTMERLNGTRGSGTAQLIRGDGGARLRLKVAGFSSPQGGGYAVWIYNSPEDARRLSATTQTAIANEIPLPSNFARYRFVEVARAIPELESGHSGLSLLRIPISELRGAR